ncbi:MAG: hypothetical protein O2815_03990 [Actinomycetota bacterium]|nr:hypothetical protein [Actinomycetota bacterium]
MWSQGFPRQVLLARDAAHAVNPPSAGGVHVLAAQRALIRERAIVVVGPMSREPFLGDARVRRG